jgi:betaine reductase
LLGEAVGDRYNRGGGNLAKAIAEQVGCIKASGCDVKAFCAGPMYAVVQAASLVQSGVAKESPSLRADHWRNSA